MPTKPLKQHSFTYSVGGPFTKNKKNYVDRKYRLFLQKWSW